MCVCHLQIGNCKNVTVMSLRSNKLEFLPDEIGQMTKLRVLNLSDNRYTHTSACTHSHHHWWLNSDRRFLQLNRQHFLNDRFCSAHMACSCHGYTLCRLIIAWAEELTVFSLNPLSWSVCLRLKNLPFTFTKLKDLAALWLSDNQVTTHINANFLKMIIQ